MLSIIKDKFKFSIISIGIVAVICIFTYMHYAQKSKNNMEKYDMSSIMRNYFLAIKILFTQVRQI